MYNTNVKTNENMFEFDLEGNTSDWGYFVDPSDPKRRNNYKQIKPKVTPYFATIEEEYDIEESDYKVEFMPKLSGYDILLSTMYVLQYILCKLPGRWWSS